MVIYMIFHICIYETLERKGRVMVGRTGANISKPERCSEGKMEIG